jgi:transposase
MNEKRLFDPEGGTFAENIRKLVNLDDSDLRESLKHAGWLEQLPAWTDENDVVIVGHRRLRIAAELKIEPVIHKFKFGKGDEADTKRLQLAIASNTGSKGLTQGDRKRIARHLYAEKNWTQQAIANAMNVSRETIKSDLLDLVVPTKLTHAKTATNPKGAGRPKGSKGRSRNFKLTVDQEKLAAGKILDEGLSRKEVADEFGVGEHTIQLAATREQARREAKADPEIDPKTLSLTAQEKFDRAVRQREAKLDAAFRGKVEDEIRRRIDEIVLPHWKEKIAQAQKLYEKRRGLMTKETFNTIRRALHPDSRTSISDRKLAEAFDAFMALEKYLLDEKESPTELPDLPRSWAEWEAAKRKASEARKRKSTSTNAVRLR